jgi:hypothetical protein
MTFTSRLHRYDFIQTVHLIYKLLFPPIPSLEDIVNLDNSFLAVDTVLLLELLDKGVVQLGVHGSQDTLLRDGAVQDLLNSNGAGHTDQLGHGRAAVGLRAAVLAEGGESGLLGAVCKLDLEFVLQPEWVSTGVRIKRYIRCIVLGVTNITRSRSPSAYCIFFSRVAQRVSRGLPLGMVWIMLVTA